MLQLPVSRKRREGAWVALREQSGAEQPIRADPIQSWNVGVDSHVNIQILVPKVPKSEDSYDPPSNKRFQSRHTALTGN